MSLRNVYAQIVDTVIKNIIVIDNDDIARQLTNASFGTEALCIECNQYKVERGDFYVNGIFFKKDPENPGVPGEVIKRTNTAEEDAYEANQRSKMLEADLAAVAINTEYLMIVTGNADEAIVDEPAADSAEEV